MHPQLLHLPSSIHRGCCPRGNGGIVFWFNNVHILLVLLYIFVTYHCMITAHTLMLLLCIQSRVLNMHSCMRAHTDMLNVDRVSLNQ